MDPLTMAMIGGGVGLLKGELVDRPREQRERNYQSVVARYSPWTGMQPTPPKEADPFGSALQGGMTGAMLGQSMQTTDLQNQLMQKQLQSGASPWMGMGPYPGAMMA